MGRAVLQPINDVEDKAGLIYLYSLLKETEPPKTIYQDYRRAP